MTEATRSTLTELAADVVASYVANNTVPAGDLPALIATVRGALSRVVQTGGVEPVQAVEKLSPAAIRKSVTPDALVSLIDGKRYRTLKRHLGTHGLTPDSYREKFGLPRDYPMVAPSYSALRSERARSMGLGRKAGIVEAQAAESA